MENYPTSPEPSPFRSGRAGEGEAPGAIRKAHLPVQVVHHLHRLLGGDARTEKMVLAYIQFRWDATTLLGVPPKAASEIVRRPADFLSAAKNHCEPELLAEGHLFLTTECEPHLSPHR